MAEYILESCTSTMDIAWDLYLRNEFAEFSWVIARTQTKGRGQFQRQWVSEKGNLFVTLRLPDSTGGLGGLLSIGIGLCIVDVLKAHHVGAQIKWPNDILVQSAKIGGILIEKKDQVVMAGIGINIVSAPDHSTRESFFSVEAGYLKKSGVNLDAFEIWNQVLENIKNQIPGMISDPLAVAQKAQDVLAFKGETVVLEDTGVCDGPAVILGINPQGHLTIQTIKGISNIRSGRIFSRVI